jgi:hypothetical protein
MAIGRGQLQQPNESNFGYDPEEQIWEERDADGALTGGGVQAAAHELTYQCTCHQVPCVCSPYTSDVTPGTPVCTCNQVPCECDPEITIYP